MSYIRSRQEGSIVFVTIDRPDKRNALTFEMLDDISAKIAEAANNPSARAVAIESSSEYFSAGVDLGIFAQFQMDFAEPEKWKRGMRQWISQKREALDQIEQAEIPVIVLVNGFCLGLGLELALACDLIFATDSATFAFPETRLGILADIGGTSRATRILGPHRTKDMLFSGRTIDIGEASVWGLITKRRKNMVELGEALREYVSEIELCSPIAVGLVKRVVNVGLESSPSVQRELESFAQSILFDTKDFLEAMRAKFSKEKPNFKNC
ncbi:MAG: enoyl-CoA hydratase/isomerase family protein [Planctomycetes bacterium]|nr:enoyl-CoA hydratase/isomerase family protein [Planctomycetota bacterium]